MDKIVFDFLHDLNENNNRDWFNLHKDIYLAARREVELFVDHLILNIKTFDPSIGDLPAKQTMFRIYRDIRFSKDKTPYKTYFGAYMAAGGRKSEEAGYYLHFAADECFASGGAYCPKSENLKKIRSEIYYNPDEFLGIVESRDFKKTFGELKGEKLKRPPAGFPKDFAGIEWLKFKDFTVFAHFTKEQATDPGFDKKLISIFKKMKPINDFINRGIRD